MPQGGLKHAVIRAAHVPLIRWIELPAALPPHSADHHHPSPVSIFTSCAAFITTCPQPASCSTFCVTATEAQSCTSRSRIKAPLLWPSNFQMRRCTSLVHLDKGHSCTHMSLCMIGCGLGHLLRNICIMGFGPSLNTWVSSKWRGAFSLPLDAGEGVCAQLHARMRLATPSLHSHIHHLAAIAWVCNLQQQCSTA